MFLSGDEGSRPPAVMTDANETSAHERQNVRGVGAGCSRTPPGRRPHRAEQPRPYRPSSLEDIPVGTLTAEPDSRAETRIPAHLRERLCADRGGSKLTP